MIRSYFSRTQLNADRMAALLVTLAPLVYFFPAVRGRIVISPDDGVIFNVPLRVAAVNLIRAGHLPLWNPYIFSGMPLHGAAQAGLLFPLNWFYLISSPPVATNLMMLATYMIAALGAYLYARRAGADITGAIATGFIWQFSAFLVEQVGHTNVLQTAAMLPWLLWAVEGYIANGVRGRGVLLAVLVAILVFAGHQQTCAYALLLTAAYSIVLVRASKHTRASYLRPLAMLAFGLSLAAVQILPTVELLRNSLRATASYDFFSSFSMPPRFAFTLFAPYLLGGGNGLLFRAPYVGPSFFGEYVAYVGLLTIMLALVAILVKPDVRTKFWAIVFVVCLLLAFGRFLPFQFYKIVYYIPVLNLFRVPARHLMEVEFALAVLAGRGVTVLASSVRGTSAERRKTIIMAIVGFVVLLITCFAVTWGRPAEFRLGRQAPLTLMRAPELFVPIIMAALSFGVLWWFVRSKRGLARACLLAVLLLDLAVYGQASGWRTNSPTRESELWRQPPSLTFLQDRERSGEGPYRILTQDQGFDPAVPVQPPAPGDWMLELQPDISMMHGIQNAAGYDGFGLSRYSRLVSDMKVWGELTDPERTLRSDSRELDLLNVRYLLMRPNSSQPAPAVAVTNFPPAPESFGGINFAAEDLTLPNIGSASKLHFAIPPVEADRLALITNLSWSEDVPDSTVVARIKLMTQSGKTVEFNLLAGEHTAEWAHDRADIKARIRHRRPPVATSYKVGEARQSYEAHSYLASFSLPERAVITRGEIIVTPPRNAPDLLLSVLRVSLLDSTGQKTFPLVRKWFTKTDIASSGVEKSSGQPEADSTPTLDPTKERWQRLSQLGNVVIYENMRALPRAWLTTEVVVRSDSEMLEIIRTGRFADGQTWDPKRVALIEAPINYSLSFADSSAKADVLSHEPNRVMIKTKSATPSVLVLSENHYPGWRAYVDGSPLETLRVNYNLRGVMLAAGEHDVEFLYRPKSVLFGLAISLLTLFGLVLWWRRLIPDRSPNRVGRRIRNRER